MKGEYIDSSEKTKYIQRLGTPYIKKGIQKFFLDQFAAGAGNELDAKFWNKKSSSRFAFDLYSWMAYDESIVDFEFEYHLPGMASGGMGPNMDVYIETKKEIIFVESKYSESANLHYLDNEYLSKAYYSKELYGKRKLTLSQRYYNYGFANEIAEFCNTFEEEMKLNEWHSGSDWFEPKQETCHLIGILIHLMNKKEDFDGKTIKLYNIYYALENDIRSEMFKTFEEKVCNLLKQIQPQLGGFTIDFKSFSVQQMLDNNSMLADNINFPNNIHELIEPFEVLAKGKTRKEMK